MSARKTRGYNFRQTIDEMADDGDELDEPSPQNSSCLYEVSPNYPQPPQMRYTHPNTQFEMASYSSRVTFPIDIWARIRTGDSGWNEWIHLILRLRSGYAHIQRSNNWTRSRTMVGINETRTPAARRQRQRCNSEKLQYKTQRSEVRAIEATPMRELQSQQTMPRSCRTTTTTIWMSIWSWATTRQSMIWVPHIRLPARTSHPFPQNKMCGTDFDMYTALA